MQIIRYIQKNEHSELTVYLPYTERNLQKAEAEAYEGVYTIENVDMFEEAAEPTADDVLNALLGVGT